MPPGLNTELGSLLKATLVAQGLRGQPRGLAALGFVSRLGTGTKRFLPEAVRPFWGLCPPVLKLCTKSRIFAESCHCRAPPAALRHGHISAPTHRDFLSKCDFLLSGSMPRTLSPSELHPGSDTGPGLVPGCQHGAGGHAPEQGTSSSPPRVGERGVGRTGRGVPGAFGLPLGPASPRSAGSPRVMGRWAAFARSCVVCHLIFICEPFRKVCITSGAASVPSGGVGRGAGGEMETWVKSV